MVATESLPLFEAEAAERKKKLAEAREAEKRAKPVPEIFPGSVAVAPEGTVIDGSFRRLASERGDARDKAAAAVGVNPRYVSDAKAIKEAAPESAGKK